MSLPLRSVKFAVIDCGAMLGILPVTANAATDPALVYHATNAGASEQADVDGTTILVFVQTQSYHFSGGNTRPDFDGISVQVELIDNATGTIVKSFYGFVPGSGTVSANLTSASIPATTVVVNDDFGDDQATLTAGAEITGSGAATHTHFIARFCGPPQPCFGQFNIVGTERPATSAMTLSGVIDGFDLSQLTFSSNGGGMSNILGVELLG